MEINIDSGLKQKIDNFKIGAILYENIEVSHSPQMLQGRLRLFQESLFFEYAEKNVTDIPSVKEWRNSFKLVGADPARYRPSNEALLRRVQKQQYISSMHSAVDLNNFLSLQYQIPLGIYDYNLLKGNILITIGTESDTYLAVNEREVNFENKILSKDSIGAFGSPYVDSKRTSVNFDTKDALHLVYLRPSMNSEDAKDLLASLTKMFLQIHGGEATYKVIE
ncbi:B3/4 domain-containing protein [Metabacillus herbersteinensis]|uniref:B3/4 domain-containing protein n=1 Tax=Metabacillus herbersteinensis TaxID=283816 RepID=A0ABV6GFL0_9BACI